MSFVDFVFLWKFTFSNSSSRNVIRVLNSLDPDQTRHLVGPNLYPSCVHRLSADDTGIHRVNIQICIVIPKCIASHENALFVLDMCM